MPIADPEFQLLISEFHTWIVKSSFEWHPHLVPTSGSWDTLAALQPILQSIDTNLLKT